MKTLHQEVIESFWIRSTLIRYSLNGFDRVALIEERRSIQCGIRYGHIVEHIKCLSVRSQIE